MHGFAAQHESNCPLFTLLSPKQSAILACDGVAQAVVFV
jgi:hypothetical protein